MISILLVAVLAASVSSQTVSIWDLYDSVVDASSIAGMVATSGDLADEMNGIQAKLDTISTMSQSDFNMQVANLQSQASGSLNVAVDSFKATTTNMNSFTTTRLDSLQGTLTDLQNAVLVDTDNSLSSTLRASQGNLVTYTDSVWNRLKSLDASLSASLSSVKADYDFQISTLKVSRDIYNGNITTMRSSIELTITAIGSQQSKVAPLVSALANTHFINRALPVYRYGVWSTYSQWQGWYLNNNNVMFGGIHPSQWGDGNYVVWSMANSKDYWRTLFNKVGNGGWSTTVWAEEWFYYSSTNSRHVGTLFRIRNKTSAAVGWTINWYYSCFGGWNEYASFTLNGEGTWSTSGNCGYCTVSHTHSIPGNRVSTLVYIASSGHPAGTRTLYSGFYDNTLSLPSGLEYVDDMDYASGGWES